MADNASKPISMSEIKSRLGAPATTSNYQVFFGLPTGPEAAKFNEYMRKLFHITTASDTTILLSLSCTDTSLPGSSFTTHEINNDYTGVTERHAYRREFDGEIDFTFLVDRDYKIIRFFEGWMSYIVGDGDGFPRSVSIVNYRIKFPKGYQVNTLHVRKFEKDILRSDQGPQLLYTFTNAFPISLSSTPISYNQSELLKLTVTMSYSRYFISREGSDTTYQFPITGSDASASTKLYDWSKIKSPEISSLNTWDPDILNVLGEDWISQRVIPDLSTLNGK